MSPEISARVDAYCDMFEKAWKSGAFPDIGSFVELQVEADLRLMVLPHLLAVDAEYRRARDGAAPSLAEYAALLNVDPAELQQMSEEVTWITGAVQTPRVGDHDNTAGNRHHGVRLSFDAKGRKPEIVGYEILSELGRGGMGVVYKARQIRAGRLVALKTIHAPHLAGSEQIKRFKAEAAAAARLNHHGIVPVYDVGECNALHYFTMGFVDGPTLEMKAREQVLSCREAAAICRDLAEALEYAHQNGVVHRDVKPHNVLIGTDGKPRLTDFGLAKRIDDNQDLTSTGQVMGTAAYMAPEQARGVRSIVEPTIDVYSLGATLYRCVTGRPPFQASSTIEVLRQLNEDEPVSPRRLNQEVDPEIETLCLKCLEKEPSRRFQTAGELAAELNRYLNREPIQSRPVSPLFRAWRWCRRKPATAGAVILGLMLLSAITGGLLYILLREKEFEIAQLQSQRTADALKVSQDAQAIAELKSQQAEDRAASSAARAATQEYFASILQIREQRLLPDPEPGWTWKALESLRRIALSKADGKDPVVLRSLIADAMTTPDLREIGRIENVPNTGSLSVSNDGKLLAAGDWAGNPSMVRIYRINNLSSPSGDVNVQFELIKTCSVDTTADFFLSQVAEQIPGPKVMQREGMWAVAFSPDDNRLAVGTRNGNISIWQIDCDPPRLLFDKRYPEKIVDRIDFSSDGDSVFAQYRVPETFRTLQLNHFRDVVCVEDRIRDFSVSSDGELFAAGPDLLFRSSLDTIEDPVGLATQGNAATLALGDSHTIAALATDPASIFDPLTGRIVANLETNERAYRPKTLEWCTNSSVVVGGTAPGNLTCWDALSGKTLLTVAYPGNEIPRIAPGREWNRLYLCSGKVMLGYELRGSSRLSTRREVPGDLSNATLPMSRVMTGRQFVHAFDIHEKLHRMAALESCTLPDASKATTGAWSRVSLFSEPDGTRLETWTCVALEEAIRNTLSNGEGLRLLSDGSGVAFTSGIPGNLAIADSQGFRFLEGVGIDVASQLPDSVVSDRCAWRGMSVPKPTETHGFRTAVTFRVPTALKRANQRIVLKLVHGDQLKEYVLGPDKIDVPGWYLFSTGDMSEANAGDWRVEAELVNIGAEFHDLSDGSPNQGDKVLPGPLFLLPWQRMRHGESQYQFPMRLGPICFRNDGGLAAVVESWTLHQWDADSKSTRPEYWRDFDNSEEDMHGLVATDEGVVVGTDSGLVALVHKDGQATFLEKARTESGTFDSRDGVTAIAVNDQNRVAVAGNLRGQIRLFELPAGSGVPAIVTDAHRTQIMALAITENGQRLASSDSTGALKFWKRHQDRLELLFEMTANKTPIQSMKFSQDGDLYLLRQDNRAVLRLELDELAAQFTNLGLPLPE